MRRAAPTLALAFAAVGSGCGWLPERMVFNGPPGMLRQVLFGSSVGVPAPDVQDARFQLPDGFHLSLFAEELPDARLLRFTPSGDLLVSQPRAGRVVRLLPDRDADGRSDGRESVVEGLQQPHGLDLREGWLYVAETDAIGRIRFDAETGRSSGRFERLVTGIPGGGNHWSRTLRFGPDGMLYLSVGSSCNVCEEKDARRAAILRYRPDGSGEAIHASGLRNSVGFDWQPGTGRLYATDNGRDLLGNDFPPCELNEIEAGGFYGWPRVNGFGVLDPDLGAGHEAQVASARPPVHGFRAHTAPLGIAFLTSEALPSEWRGVALVALHGSWNRTVKDGYEVVSLHWQPDGNIREEPFLTGFLQLGAPGGSAAAGSASAQGPEVIGRPVDVAEGPDGAIYISDDYAGAIYRVRYGAAPAGGSARAAKPHREPAGADPLEALSPDERAREAARGAALYESHACYRCHEVERAERGATPLPLAQLSSRYAIAALADFLAAPTPPMPLFALSAQERRALAIHLLSAHGR